VVLDSQSIIVDGEYGEFEGSTRDRVVIDEYNRLGTWAKPLVELISARLLSCGAGTFIDVGANIGLVCVPVIERTRAQGVCFEPEPQNFSYLSRNIARHGLSERIACHALACHAARGTMQLSLSEDNLGDHRLQRAGQDEDAARALFAAETQSRATLWVKTERLDDVLRDVVLPKPVVMKVDAQGSEASIFDGAVETLARVDHLITEFWPRGIVAHGDSASRFSEHMRTFPFGAVLHVLPLPEPLHTSTYVFEQLSWIRQDGSDPGFFDMLFSRHQQLPKR